MEEAGIESGVKALLEAILKKTLDFTNANAELLHERVEKIENPPKETTWRAFLRLWKRK